MAVIIVPEQIDSKTQMKLESYLRIQGWTRSVAVDGRGTKVYWTKRTEDL